MSMTRGARLLAGVQGWYKIQGLFTGERGQGACLCLLDGVQGSVAMSVEDSREQSTSWEFQALGPRIFTRVQGSATRPGRKTAARGLGVMTELETRALIQVGKMVWEETAQNVEAMPFSDIRKQGQKAMPGNDVSAL